MTLKTLKKFMKCMFFYDLLTINNFFKFSLTVRIWPSGLSCPCLVYLLKFRFWRGVITE